MDAAEAPLFSSMAEFLDQLGEPLVTINISRPLPAFVLQKYFRRFTKEITQRCNSFIGKTYRRPKLPSSEQFCSIAFTMDNDNSTGNPVRICFRLGDLYCLVASNGNGQLYQVGKSGTTRKITPCARLLGKEESYGKLLNFRTGSKLDIKSQSFVRAYHSVNNLGTRKENFDEASFGIGIIAMAFMEPCRQATPKAWLVGPPGRYHSSEEYGTIVYGGEEWEVIHQWEENSLAAEGMKEGKHGTMLWINDNTQTLEAQKEVLIVNSNPDAPAVPSILGGISL